MHISKLWATGAQTISTLRLACAALSVVSLSMGLLLYIAFHKKPLVIEKSCSSRVLNIVDEGTSNAEVESFLLEAIPARFDSTDKRIEFLSLKELKRKVREQKQLARKKIDQRMLVDRVRFEGEAGETIEVHMTRVISLENIRSAFPYLLRVQVKRVERSELNPYGLVLTDAKEIKISKKKEDQ